MSEAMTVRQEMEREGKAHVSFADWIAEARIYATSFYNSDAELGDDSDMQCFYDDGYSHTDAVDEVFSDGGR